MGYSKIQLVQGYNLVGAQFTQVGGDVLNLATVGTLDDSFTGFDEEGYYTVSLKKWDTARQSYTSYGWSGTSPEDFGVVEDDSLNNLWLNGDYEDDGSTMAPNAGFWIQADGTGNFTVSGEVPTEDVTINLVAGYNLVANPFPAPVKISAFGTLGSMYSGFDEEGYYTVTLKTWDTARQSYNTYGWTGTSPEDFGVVEDDSLNNLWLNGDYEDDGKSVDTGRAVWIYADKAGTITFKSPVQ